MQPKIWLPNLRKSILCIYGKNRLRVIHVDPDKRCGESKYLARQPDGVENSGVSAWSGTMTVCSNIHVHVESNANVLFNAPSLVPDIHPTIGRLTNDRATYNIRSLPRCSPSGLIPPARHGCTSGAIRRTGRPPRAGCGTRERHS